MSKSADSPLVVLVPGLWMPPLVMLPLAWRLQRAGFATRLFGYASVRARLDENAARLADFLRSLAVPRLYLVGHSLGGVVALHSVCTHRPAGVEKVMLLGSPYCDSYAGRRLARRRGGGLLVGRTVSDWLEAPRPGAPDGVMVGVVAGTVPFGLGMIVAPGQPRPTDGVVTVAETEVPGMADRVLLPVSHSSMLVSAAVGRCVVHFLRHGRFASRQDATA